MKYTEYVEHVRYLTKTNSTTFTDADIVRFTNIFIDDFADAIEERNQSYFDMEMYTDLIADERRYPLPDEWMNRVIRLSVNLDGQKLIKATPIGFGEYNGTLEESEIRSRFATMRPMYTLLGKSIILLTGEAIIDMPDGLQLWSKVYPAQWTLANLPLNEEMSVDPTNTSIGMPRQFHELLARRVAIEYKQTRDKAIPLSEREQFFDRDFVRSLNAITEDNLDEHRIVQLPYNDGSKY